jgi:peptidoglycan/LPS O-acetylase OafA/YrhL
LPACFVFCAFFVGIIILFNDYRFTTSPGVDATLTSVGYALTYSLNWPVALGLAPPAGFGHLWSLSVEEQYYLLWPGVLLVMLRLGLTGRRMMLVTLVAVLLSAAMPFMLPELGWRRLQYGTDFRAQELLAGSLIAQLYVFNVVREAPLNRRPFKLLFGTAGLAFLAMVFMSNVRDDSMYRGGYTFLTITCAILVLGGAFSLSGPVSSLLGNRVLVYLGRRSYALYLWHMPIGIWLRHLEIEEQLVLAGLLSFAAAELSYRLVERPALRLKARLSPSTGFRSATSRRPAKVDAPATQAA